MAEPVTTAASGFALSKLYYGIAGLFGGYMLSFFWQPAKLKNHSRAAAGAIIGGASVGSAVIFGGALSVFLGLDPNDANVALAVGGGIGIMAIGIMSFVANFFDKREDQDIVEVATELRRFSGPGTNPKPEKKRPPAPPMPPAKKRAVKKSTPKK